MQSKTCTKCGLTKHVLCFAVRNASKDGLSPMCRDCKSEYSSTHNRANVGVLKTKRLKNNLSIAFIEYGLDQADKRK